MKLTFLGTRGEIDARTRRYRMHTSLLVSYRSANVMIDCGLDWLGKLKRVSPAHRAVADGESAAAVSNAAAVLSGIVGNSAVADSQLAAAIRNAATIGEARRAARD